MYWGAGPELGLLTVLGYLFFLGGALAMWRGREDVSVWIYGEVACSSLSRYTPVGPFYSPRDHSRLKLFPEFFSGSLSRMPRALVYRSVILLTIAPLCVLLDFFF